MLYLGLVLAVMVIFFRRGLIGAVFQAMARLR